MSFLSLFILLGIVGIVVADDCSKRLNVITQSQWPILKGFMFQELLDRALLVNVAPIWSPHAILHTADRRTYIRGNSQFFQLHFAGSEDVTRELVELRGRRLKDIKFGQHWKHPFAVVLTTEGSVWTAGRNDFGNLGHHGTGHQPVFSRVMGMPPIKSIVVGAYHVVALATNGMIFSWGCNMDYQLGYDTGLKNQLTPRRMYIWAEPTPADQVCCGMWNCAILAANEVYTWGFHWYLGRPGEGKSPGMVRGLENESIEKLLCGSGHLMVLTKKGSLFGWGRTGEGALLNVRNWLPYAAELDLGDRTVHDVVVGRETTLIRTGDGDMEYFGQQSYHYPRSVTSISSDFIRARDLLYTSHYGQDTWGAVELDNWQC